MSAQETSEKKRPTDWRGWLVLAVYIGVPSVIIVGAAFVGFVKFMAWWRVAFGDCSP